MSFLSFLSSHRLHSSHRPWIEPLNVRFDLVLHENPAPDEAPDLAPSLSVADKPAGLIPDYTPSAFEPPPAG